MRPDTDGWLGSPCVGICHTDPATGWCGGCGRSGEELAAWGDMPAAVQRATWSDLPRRMAILGPGYQLLPWTGARLLQRLAELSMLPGAGWRMGVHGAAATCASHGEFRAVTIEDGALVVRSEEGRLAVRPTAGTRAFDLADRQGGVRRIVLALHRVRFKVLNPSGIACLGQDAEALQPARRDAALFDLGLGRRPMRFCIRTHDPRVIDLLRQHAGGDVLGLPELVQAFAAGTSDHVVVSPLGRIEIDGASWQAGGTARTELVADLLQTGRELAPGQHLPPDYVACAQLLVDDAA
jgi:predicted Fe-S protein YdhL (DUF1289 family)